MGTAQLQGRAVERGGNHYLLASVPFGLKNIGELHIAMEGSWEGHPQGGFKFTSDVFDEMIANFEEQKNPLPVDYEHGAFPEPGQRADTRAAGWIQRLEKRQGEAGYDLWAIVEWTDVAAEMIRAGEYKFCSPAFSMKSIDRSSGDERGPELANVALTNLPFLDGQSPIRLSFVCAVSAAEPAPPPSTQPAAPPSTEQAPPLAPQQAEQDQARAMNEMLAAFIDAVAATADVDRAAVVAALSEMDIADVIAGRVREHLDVDGMPQEKDMTTKEEKKPEAPKSDDDKRADEIEARANANANTILLSRVEAIEAETAKIKAEREAEKTAAINARIGGMVGDGALLEPEREDATWMLSNQPDRFERIYGSRKGAAKPVPIGVSQAGDEKIDPETVQLSDLSNGDRVAYRLLTNNGMKADVALKRIAAQRNKKAG